MDPYQRRRTRHRARASGAHLRAVLHDQGGGGGHRARPRRGTGDRGTARRMGDGGERAGTGCAIRHLPRGGAAGSGGITEAGVVTGRVLLVDDVAALCEAYADSLGRRGWEVVWRTSAGDALEVLRSEDID